MKFNFKGTIKASKASLAYEIPNILDGNNYKILANNFPDEKYFSRIECNYPGQRIFANVPAVHPEIFNEFLSSSVSEWQDLINYCHSKEFIYNMNKITTLWEKIKLFGLWGLRFLRPWKRIDNIDDLHLKKLSNWFFQTYHITFVFQEVSNGGFIGPHTDASRKLYNSLFYFPDDNWLPEYGGGTSFYLAKRKKDLFMDRSIHGPDPSVNDGGYPPTEDFIKWHETTYEPNRMVGFVRNNYSWHGVEEIKCPLNLSRKALIILICVPKPFESVIKRINDRILNRIVRFVHNIN